MSVSQTLRGDVLLVTIDNPPVNALSHVERQGLIDAIAAAEAGDALAVVIHGAGGRFIAGADVREFGQPPRSPHLPDVVDAIEMCGLPVIAAIDGQALGGGLEIALGCHYRIALEGSRLGLPEVTLGLVPGAGGTQRLPRLIDPLSAAIMVSGGKPVSASDALAKGLIDRIVGEDLIEAAIAFARGLSGTFLSERRLAWRHPKTSNALLTELDRLMASTAARSKGAIAPVEALNLVRTALTAPFAEGMRTERDTFLRLRDHEQAAALRHIFFAERAAAKPPADVGQGVVRPIRRVGIIGAGTMGAGIAMSVADAGLPVTLIELSADALARGMARIDAAYRSSAERGRISADVAAERIALIEGSDDYQALAGCDLVIEAAFEAMEVKHQIFSELVRVTRPGTVLATNTSYLDIDVIAAKSGRAADVVGLHYFSPANVMKLLEIVRGRETAPDMLATVLAFAKRTGKIPVVAGVCNGFIGNRMLRAYTREAGLLLLEGATPEQVDGALTGFGMAMGPFAVADLSGIDIGYKARRAMAPGSYEPMAVVVHDRLVEAGHLGQKTGSGFYSYEAGKRSDASNPLVADILAEARAAENIVPRSIADGEIVDRCLLALANEGGFILDEGIAARAGDIDVVYVNGYGFPRHRGGPMFHAEQLGAERVTGRMAAFALGRFSHWWAPSRFLSGPTPATANS